MFIDFVTLLLINMVAGLVLLAMYIGHGLGEADTRYWAPGFFIVGVIASIFGVAMTVRWPLPGAFNIAFGEMSTMFGLVFLGAGLALAMRWSLLSVALYAAFPGIAAIIIGIRIIDLGLTKSPLAAGIGYIITGLAGVLAVPALYRLPGRRIERSIVAGILLLAAINWAITGYAAYWSHLSDFARYMPH